MVMTGVPKATVGGGEVGERQKLHGRKGRGQRDNCIKGATGETGKAYREETHRGVATGGKKVGEYTTWGTTKKHRRGRQV